MRIPTAVEGAEHPVVQKLLDMGYRESVGQDVLAAAFQDWVAGKGLHPRDVRGTEQDVSEFFDHVVAQQLAETEAAAVDDSASSSADSDSSNEPEEGEEQTFDDLDADFIDDSEIQEDQGGSWQMAAEAQEDPPGFDGESDGIEEFESDEENAMNPPWSRQPQGGDRGGPSTTQPKEARKAQCRRITDYLMPRQPGDPPRPAVAPSNAPATPSELRMPILDLANTKIFGNRDFRPQQRQVIEAVLQGQNCFVLMPTGGGKSLCYQLPAVVSRGLTVVITPLLSLMQDQVSALVRMPCGGIPATYLSSQQGAEERKAVYRELRKMNPSCKLLYITPEQLVKSSVLLDILQALDQRRLLASIVVDEIASGQYDSYQAHKSVQHPEQSHADGNLHWLHMSMNGNSQLCQQALVLNYYVSHLARHVSDKRPS